MGRWIHKLRRQERGLTLIELSIVALIIGIMTAVAIPTINNLSRAHLRASASSLSGTIRYAYDLAARKNAYFRLAFDLGERSYWLEASSDKFLMDREKDEVRNGAVSTEPKSSRRRRFVSRGFIESGEMWKPKEPAAFANFAGALTPKVTLPEGISFMDVWVAHQSEAATTGRAYLHFFPTGMTERAMIHLEDEDKNVFTLWVDPITGRPKVYPQYVEIPED